MAVWEVRLLVWYCGYSNLVKRGSVSVIKRKLVDFDFCF